MTDEKRKRLQEISKDLRESVTQVRINLDELLEELDDLEATIVIKKVGEVSVTEIKVQSSRWKKEQLVFPAVEHALKTGEVKIPKETK